MFFLLRAYQHGQRTELQITRIPTRPENGTTDYVHTNTTRERNYRTDSAHLVRAWRTHGCLFQTNKLRQTGHKSSRQTAQCQSSFKAGSPRIRFASCRSLGMTVTHFPWMAHRLLSSSSETRKASAPSCSANITLACSLYLSAVGAYFCTISHTSL